MCCHPAYYHIDSRAQRGLTTCFEENQLYFACIQYTLHACAMYDNTCPRAIYYIHTHQSRHCGHLSDTALVTADPVFSGFVLFLFLTKKKQKFVNCEQNTRVRDLEQ